VISQWRERTSSAEVYTLRGYGVLTAMCDDKAMKAMRKIFALTMSGLVTVLPLA
jgi:hypothetical protein